MNTFSGVVFFVEGDDDSRFIERIAMPCVDSQFLHIDIMEWSEMKDSKVNDLIRSYKGMAYKIVFIGDRDAAPCITEKRCILKRRFSQLDSDDIVVSVPEIEAWYVSGAEGDVKALFPQWCRYNVDRLEKEIFNRHIPEEFDSRIAFMVSLLDEFSVDEAVRVSDSFQYLVDEFCKVL